MNWNIKRIIKGVWGGGKTVAGLVFMTQPLWGPLAGLPPLPFDVAVGGGSALAGSGLAGKLVNFLCEDSDRDGKSDRFVSISGSKIQDKSKQGRGI